MKIRKKINGFTLIELLLYVGLVALLSIGIYSYYNKKQTNATVYNLTKNLTLIDKGVIDIYSTVASFTTLNNTFAISSKIVPPNIVSGASNISDQFGGSITIATATITGNPGYSMTLDTIPSYACTKLATTAFASYVQEVAINGLTVKTAGAPITSAQIPNIAAQCNNTNNTIVYRNLLVPTLQDAVGSAATTRNKETPYYIATVGSPSTGVGPVCAGGSTWNGSFCSCPANTEWSGSACITFGTTSPQAGWCPRGQGWLPDTKICAALPNGSSTNQYNSGRNLPGSITTPVVQTTVGGQIAPAPGTEVIAGKTVTWTIGNVDNTTVQVCVNGSWDATTRRCITP